MASNKDIMLVPQAHPLDSILVAHPNTRFVRFAYVDFGGILRVQAMPVRQAKAIVAKGEHGSPLSSVSPGTHFLDITGHPVFEFVLPGNDFWIPDWTSARYCTYEAQNGTILVMCSMFTEKTPLSGISTPVYDPRTVLARSVSRAHDEFGVDFLVGSEIEFCLLEHRRADTTLDYPTIPRGAAQMRTQGWAIVEEIVVLLEDAGIQVWTFVSEGGPAAFEIALGPLPPMQAIDALVYAKEAIRTVTFRHGLHATLHPKVMENSAYNGCHFHVSLNGRGMPEDGWQGSERDSKGDIVCPNQAKVDAFVAAQLLHFPGLAALFLPTVDSYKRARMFGGGLLSWGSWKGTTVRRVERSRVELRAPDAMGNMYLALGAILGVGVEAMANKQQIPSLPLVGAYQGQEHADKVASLGKLPPVPKDLTEALAAFRKDMVLEKVLGTDIFERYALYREHERDTVSKMTDKERRELYMTYH